MKLRNPGVFANVKSWFYFITHRTHVFDIKRRLVSPVNKLNDYSAPWNCVYFTLDGLVRAVYEPKTGYSYEEVIIPFENLSQQSKDNIWASEEQYDYDY